MRQKIAIDIDDVLADSTETIRHTVNNHLGVNLSYDDYRGVEADYWGYYEAVWEAHGIHKDVSFGDVEDLMEGHASSVAMLAGAEFALSELAKSYDIVLITAREQKREESTRQWLAEQLPGRQLDVYFSANGRLNNKNKSKGELCNELGADWLIDDSPVNCQSAIGHGVKAVLFDDYGWQHTPPVDVIRCADWPAVIEVLV